jgi:hypothetical protein
VDMNDSAPFDFGPAHKYFSAHCFNEAWKLIEKTDRTPKDDQQMLALSFASLWHWTQREDCSRRNLSIAYWQLARIFALLGDGANATRYGETCLENSIGEPPFFLAYAHEALARAATLTGDGSRAAHHLAEAGKLSRLVDDAEDRAMLEKDLLSLQSRAP